MRVEQSSSIAFVGAGGKTSCAFQIARQQPEGAAVTTTTKLGKGQAVFADELRILPPNNQSDVSDLLKQKIILFAGNIDEAKNKILGLSSEQLNHLRDDCFRAKVKLLIEADGARWRSFKAPANHEPVIPAWADAVVVVAGLSVVGKPITDEFMFRPEIIARLAGANEGSLLTLTHMCNVLSHAQGGLKSIPNHSRKILLLNQLDLYLPDIKEKLLIKKLCHSSFDQIILGSSIAPESFFEL